MRQENFIFIGDSTNFDYLTSRRPCNLQRVGEAQKLSIRSKYGLVLGDLFFKSGYGLALQRNDPRTEAFNAMILKYQANGFLDKLKHKWLLMIV